MLASQVERGTENEAYMHENQIVANAALGTGILISQFAQPRKQQTLQPGPNYATRSAAASDNRMPQLGPNYAGIIRMQHLACRR